MRYFTIRKARIPAWGYEITSKGYHNIAPTIEAAKDSLFLRFGSRIRIRVIE